MPDDEPEPDPSAGTCARRKTMGKTVGQAIAAAEAEGRIQEGPKCATVAQLPAEPQPALFDAGPPDVVVIDGLPFPPSVNDYLTNVIIPRIKGKNIGTCKSFRIQTFASGWAKQFRMDCADVVRLANKPKLKGFLRCEVVFFPPNHIRRDLDNMPKCLLDGLKHADLFDDDSQIKELSLKWGPLKPPDGKTAIRLTTLGV